ncbi:hypothetical protein N2152v2_011208 [Parachlorella kessleri]
MAAQVLQQPAAEVILLEDDHSPEGQPESPRVEILSSTVAPVRLKRPRLAAPQAAAAVAGKQGGSGLQALVQQARDSLAAPAAQQPPPEPKGVKCGICLEVMGGSSGKAMASGPCGHVYCRDCLTEAVRAQKKCPTCRRNLQLRQLHQVFVEFT